MVLGYSCDKASTLRRTTFGFSRVSNVYRGQARLASLSEAQRVLGVESRYVGQSSVTPLHQIIGASSARWGRRKFGIPWFLDRCIPKILDHLYVISTVVSRRCAHCQVSPHAFRADLIPDGWLPGTNVGEATAHELLGHLWGQAQVFTSPVYPELAEGSEVEGDLGHFQTFTKNPVRQDGTCIQSSYLRDITRVPFQRFEAKRSPVPKCEGPRRNPVPHGTGRRQPSAIPIRTVPRRIHRRIKLERH